MSQMNKMDEEDIEFMTIAQIGIYLLYRRKKKENSTAKRKWWIRPWIARRLERGAYHNLIQEMRDEDQGSFANFFRLYPNLFEELEFLIQEKIRKQDTTYRNSISTGERLAITLRFLASGKIYVNTFLLGNLK